MRKIPKVGDMWTGPRGDGPPEKILRVERRRNGTVFVRTNRHDYVLKVPRQ